MQQYLVEIYCNILGDKNLIVCWNKEELSSTISKLKENEKICSIQIVDNIINFSEWVLDRQEDEIDGFKKIMGI